LAIKISDLFIAFVIFKVQAKAATSKIGTLVLNVFNRFKFDFIQKYNVGLYVSLELTV